MYGTISRTRLLLSTAAAAAAVVTPAATAMHAPGALGSAATPADPTPAYVAIQYAQLGPKYVTLSHRPSAAAQSTRLSR
jgi:hypothetical protein